MIKEFKFQKFEDIGATDEAAKNFSFKQLQIKKIDEDQLDEELDLISKNSFQISSDVKNHRGYGQIEKEKFEKKVISEIDIRLAELKDQAREEGYQEGLKRGLEESKKNISLEYQEKLSELGGILNGIKEGTDQCVQTYLMDWHRLLKNAVKWITLRETKSSEYIEPLLSKLVQEINERDHLIIKVDEKTSEFIDQAIKDSEKELGKLGNVRVEVDHELSHPSIIVEGQNGIIDGSMEAQFASLDQIFSKLGSHES